MHLHTCRSELCRAKLEKNGYPTQAELPCGRLRNVVPATPLYRLSCGMGEGGGRTSSLSASSSPRSQWRFQLGTPRRVVLEFFTVQADENTLGKQ